MDKCFITSMIIFAFIVAIVTTGFIVRYEDKLNNYESRIDSLERELSGIYQLWEDEYGSLVVNEKDFEYEIPNHPGLFGSDENSDDYISKEEEEAKSESVETEHTPKPEDKEKDKDSDSDEHGQQEVKMDMTRSRKKRQIPVQDLPTFGPNVERTADGVPILESSYLDREKTERVRPAAAYFSRYEQPTTTESEGLRLYEGLQATGGRNEPRSLNHYGGYAQNGILPHHRTSAAWTDRDDRRSQLRTRSGGSWIQLKSSDSQTQAASLPSGFGESTGPNFSDEITYRRSSSGRRYTNTYNNRSGVRYGRRNGYGSRNAAALRNPPSSSSSFATHRNSSSSYTTCLNCKRSSDNAASTYHRRSRVPSSDILIPSASSSTTSGAQLRSLSYPPLQRFGRGDGEVIARVIQSDTDKEEDLLNTGHTQTQTTTSDHTESSTYRRQGSRRVNPSRQAGTGQQAYRHGRKYPPNHANNNKNRDSGSGTINIVRADAWVESPGKPVAAHYVADVSNYTTTHRHYEGNGRLRNADGIFAAWKPSEWMESASGSSTSTTGEDGKNFALNQNGVLTIKKPGLYYVYAQIHYLDEHDINGYVVQVNTTPFLQCTTMTETTNGRNQKSNSCFTAGITHLKENDRLLVRDIETNRYSSFKPERSFFGLMKIGDMN